MKAFRHCPWASADIPGVITYDRDRPALTSQRRRRTDGEDFCPSGVVAEVEGERVPHHLLRGGPCLHGGERDQLNFMQMPARQGRIGEWGHGERCKSQVKDGIYVCHHFQLGRLHCAVSSLNVET